MEAKVQDLERRLAEAKATIQALIGTTEIDGSGLGQLERGHERFRSTFENAGGGVAHLGADGAWLQRIVDSKMIGIVFGDVNGDIYEANDYFLRMLGYTREELKAGLVKQVELSPLDNLPGEYQARVGLEQTGVCNPYEKQYYRKDGSRVWVLVDNALLPGGDSVAFILDISRWKRAEQAQEASEERFSNAFDRLCR